MKFLQSSQLYFARLGITASQSKHKYPFLNVKILSVFLVYCLFIVAYTLSIIRVAQSFREYMELIFRVALPMLLITMFAIVVLKMEKLFQLVDNIEKFIGKSRFSHIIHP